MEKNFLELKEEIIRKLVEEREKLYQEIKEKLTPIIFALIGEEEKKKGYAGYWEVFGKLKEKFDLSVSDYERIIEELRLEGKIMKEWLAGIGGFLRIKR